MRKKFHGIVPLLVASMLVAGFALPAIAQVDQEDDSGMYGEESEPGAGAQEESTYGTERGLGAAGGYDYDTDEDWFESWYGESDAWIE